MDIEVEIGSLAIEGFESVDRRRLVDAFESGLRDRLAAAEQLGQADRIATSLGLHPTLAALETLLYPFSARIIANQILVAFGVLEVIPPEAPLTLLVWGPKRIVPIRIQDLSITEEA